MKITAALFTLIALSLGTLSALADDKPATSSPNPAKLKVLYITGGGYHKYDVLTPIIVDGIKKHANADVDVHWNLEGMRDKNLGDGYDAIIYNICFAGDEKANTLPKEADVDLINNALRVTRDGKPTVVLHCTMHTFMASDDWTEFCGERTRHHDKYKPFGTVKATPDHPVMKHFPDDWTTPGDELYRTLILPPDTTPLLKANIKDESDNISTVCWVHTYGKGNVFGTTLGHDEKTVSQDAYLRLVADGLLWACGKLDADGNPKPGYGPSE